MNARLARGSAGLSLAGFAALTAAAQTGKPPDSGFRLVSPAANTKTTAASISLILSGGESAKAPELTLNGRPVVLGRLSLSGAGTAPNRRSVWVAEAPLTAGANVFRLAGATICSVTRGERGVDSSPEERRFRAHPPPSEKKACLDCHKRAGDSLSPARTPSTCHTCHSEDDLPVIHRHVMDPFARCQTCHDPHGGDRRYLLKDAREKLCIRCHEAGHYKPQHL